MNGIFTRRRALLLISAFAILMLVILASGLSDLQFAPPHSGHLGGVEVRPVDANLAEGIQKFEKSPFLQRSLIVGGLFLALLLSLIFMPAEFRKAFFKRLFWIGVFAIIVFLFVKPSENDGEMIMPEESLGSAYMLEVGEETIAPPPEVFTPEEVSPIWSYLITLVIVLALAALTWWLWRVWTKSQEQEDLPLKDFAFIARASLDDLDAGAEWEDAIVRSYAQMGQVVNERRGIRRDIEMTPNEFSERLIESGLPKNPVQGLTRLFERVRYSRHSAGEEEVAEAVACLNEIASVFGEKL